MQKVFLLLRSNKQTGPFSLEELVQAGLKPDDLIWVEGRSACWSYPSEITVLKQYVQPKDKEKIKPEEPAGAVSQQPDHQAYQPPKSGQSPTVQGSAPKRIHVSLPTNVKAEVPQRPVIQREASPAGDLEQKADELRKRVQSYAAEKQTTDPDDTVQTKYSRSIKDIEEDYTSWVYKQKSKSKTKLPDKLLLMALGSILFIAGLYWIAKYTFTGPDSTEIVQTEMLTSKTEDVQPKAETLATEPGETMNVDASIRYDVPETKDLTIASPPAATKKNTQAAAQKKDVKIAAPETARRQVDNTALPGVDHQKASNKAKEEPAVVHGTNKKKTLTDKIDGFFNKFKKKKTEEKPEEKTEEVTKQPLPGAETNERNARRRVDEPIDPVEKENLAEFVDVSSNAPSENWMLGVQGLKLTLKNRSSTTVQSAAVEVRYFNQQNEVIERKTITFSNVPAKKSVVVSAPDHRLADHTDYHLVSVN